MSSTRWLSLPIVFHHKMTFLMHLWRYSLFAHVRTPEKAMFLKMCEGSFCDSKELVLFAVFNDAFLGGTICYTHRCGNNSPPLPGERPSGEHGGRGPSRPTPILGFRARICVLSPFRFHSGLGIGKGTRAGLQFRGRFVVCNWANIKEILECN